MMRVMHQDNLWRYILIYYPLQSVDGDKYYYTMETYAVVQGNPTKLSDGYTASVLSINDNIKITINI